MGSGASTSLNSTQNVSSSQADESPVFCGLESRKRWVKEAKIKPTIYLVSGCILCGMMGGMLFGMLASQVHIWWAAMWEELNLWPGEFKPGPQETKDLKGTVGYMNSGAHDFWSHRKESADMYKLASHNPLDSLAFPFEKQAESWWWTGIVLFTWEVTTVVGERKAQWVGHRRAPTVSLLCSIWPPDLPISHTWNWMWRLLWAAVVNVGSQDATRASGNANHLRWGNVNKHVLWCSLRSRPHYFPLIFMLFQMLGILQHCDRRGRHLPTLP